MKDDKKNEKAKIILALALMKHLHNTGKISDHVYQNIKREYEPKTKNN